MFHHFMARVIVDISASAAYCESLISTIAQLTLSH